MLYKPKKPKQIKKELEFQDNYEAVGYIIDLEKQIRKLKRSLAKHNLAINKNTIE